MKNKRTVRFDKYNWSFSTDAVKKRILDELKRLSETTGYPIDSLKIEFYYDENENTLAYFSHYSDAPVGFFFNLAICNGRSANQIIDVCRHEFSHYAVFMRKIGNPKDAHGTAWKGVCRELGARPEAYASNEKTQHFYNV